MTGPAHQPDPARSRAVLIGVSAYDRMPPIPATEANVTALNAVFTDLARWGLPPEHCRLVVNPATAQDILDPIHEAATAATDALVVYFAGHGLLDNGELELALVGGAPDALHHAVRFAQVRREVVQTARRCRAKVVILDCCFSGRAMSGFMAGPRSLADQAVVDGTYLMTATAETVLALAPPGSRHTAFTGVLLDALTNGVPGGPDPLDMDTLFEHVESGLRGRNQPIPQRRVRNDGSRIALVRNPAADVPAATPPPGAGQWPRWRRPAGWAAAVVLVLLIALLAGLLVRHRDRAAEPRTGGTASPAVAASPVPGIQGSDAVSASPVPGSRGAEAPATTGSVLPRTRDVTASTRRDVVSSDGLVRIGLTAVNQDGISYFLVTPQVSCRVEGSDLGESVVVPQGDGVWITFVPVRQILPTVDAGDPGSDIKMVFSVDWGRGDQPRASRPCR